MRLPKTDSRPNLRLPSRTTMMSQLVVKLNIMIALVMAGTIPCRAADDCVVIVNKANPVASVSAGDLRKMFLGEKPTWASLAKVSAVTPAPDKPEYAASIKRATGMSGGDFKRYFIQLSFLGKVVPPPRTLDSNAAIVKFVATYPGAVGCVPEADAGAAVKVIKVE